MTDKILPLGDGDNSVRLKDTGDGTFSVVLATVPQSGPTASDKLVDIGDGVSKKRLRDLGDGSFAEVIYRVQ